MIIRKWEEIRRRIAQAIREPSPLFIACDSEDSLRGILRESSQCERARVSDFCGEDTTANMDEFGRTLDGGAPLVVLGAGEYLALTGDSAPLRALWSRRKRARTLIVPVWGDYRELEKLSEAEPYRLEEIALFAPRSRAGWSYKNYLVAAPAKCPRFKAALRQLEEGYSGEIRLSTRVKLSEEWGETVSDPAAVYRELHPASAYRGPLSEEQLLALEEESADWEENLFGLKKYLSFFEEAPANAYLKLVLEKSPEHSVFRKNFIDLILDFAPEDAEFVRLLAARADFLPNLSPADLREFVLKTEAFPEKRRVAYLTDGSEIERREILKCVAADPGLLPRAAYKDLKDYARPYDFGEGAIERRLTAYFEAYKQAKLANKVTEELARLNRENARLFYDLPTRMLELSRHSPDATLLYWLDALGCEYLGFVAAFAEEHGLRMKARATRAALPTLTEFNRAFYDEWPGPKKSNKDLDKVKHGEYEDYDAGQESRRLWPLHLSRELIVLRSALEDILRALKSGGRERVILASDHGATRMAVISREEQAWEMPEKGRHSGRCCRIGEAGGFKPEAAVLSDDGQWLCLTDYSRIKGGRQSLAEAHGGATLEEVVAPVIELALAARARKAPAIMWIAPRSPLMLKRADKFIEARVSVDAALKAPELRLRDKSYPLERDGAGLYFARIPAADLERRNEARVWDEGERLEPPLVFEKHAGLGDNDFDDLF